MQPYRRAAPQGIPPAASPNRAVLVGMSFVALLFFILGFIVGIYGTT